MTLQKFIALATVLNEMWRGKFTTDEIKDYATELWHEWLASIIEYEPTKTMISFCTNLVEDMDKGDYADVDDTLDIFTMVGLVEFYYNEYCN